MNLVGVGPAMTGVEELRKFNGKEVNREFGLEWSDFGARFYDGQVARWLQVDPLAEEFAMLGSYHYANLNPIYFVDKDGMKGEDYWKTNDYGHYKANKAFVRTYVTANTETFEGQEGRAPRKVVVHTIQEEIIFHRKKGDTREAVRLQFEAKVDSDGNVLGGSVSKDNISYQYDSQNREYVNIEESSEAISMTELDASMFSPAFMSVVQEMVDFATEHDNPGANLVQEERDERNMTLGLGGLGALVMSAMPNPVVRTAGNAIGATFTVIGGATLLEGEALGEPLRVNTHKVSMAEKDIYSRCLKIEGGVTQISN